MHRLFFISAAACLALASPVAAESRFCRDAFDTVKDELEDYSRNGKISNRDLREIRDEIGDRALACNGVQLLLGAEPPPLNWSTTMFRKRRTRNGKQATEARRDRYKVTPS